MKSEFEDLRVNDNHFYDTDKSGDKDVLKIYGPNEELIAKRVILKKSTRYFGCKNYKDYLQL
jgi:hypothetical protein